MKIDRKSCKDGKLLVSREDMEELFDTIVEDDMVVIYFFVKCFGDYYNLYWCNKDSTISGKIKNIDTNIHFASCKCNKDKFD